MGEWAKGGPRVRAESTGCCGECGQLPSRGWQTILVAMCKTCLEQGRAERSRFSGVSSRSWGRGVVGPFGGHGLLDRGPQYTPAQADGLVLPQVVDKWFKSNDEESFAFARLLISQEGLLCGEWPHGPVGGGVGDPRACALCQLPVQMHKGLVVARLQDYSSPASWLELFVCLFLP